MSGIAIIGLSLRFPQADSLAEFWDNLVAEKSLVTKVPADRWGESDKSDIVWGGFIEDADCFDASFFKISPREANLMDPQQRIILELAWKAVEDAGYRVKTLESSRTGVFIGVTNTDYTEAMEKEVKQVDAYMPTGTSLSILANRISYQFDLKGPSITVDTACASSLSAIHLATRALENGECEYALAGGVNLCWTPRRFIALSQSGLLSKEGRCKSFDAEADGYVRGEGGAVLLLKPLQQAAADKDHIYAVIKGVGTNHGGRTNSLTITNPLAQAALIEEVYERAGISPDSVSYIETHGPGTPLGDPIEILGLKTAFKQLGEKFGRKPAGSAIGLGSVKSNMGHLEAAAGIAGVIKVIAALKNKTLPKTLHFQSLNPVINLTGSPFYIVDKTMPWETKKTRGKGLALRRAGVSSFGFGGSNAHLVLEEYLAPEPAVAGQVSEDNRAGLSGPFLVPLCAQNADRLREYAGRLLEYLSRAGADESIANIAYTLQTGREPMAQRVLFLVEDTTELLAQLRLFLEKKGEPSAGIFQGQARQIPEVVSLFAADEDYRELLSKWIEKREYKKMAELWVRGVSFDWLLFYERQLPRRISLPGYPFARERFRLPSTAGDGTKEVKESFRETCYLTKGWQPDGSRPARQQPLKRELGIAAILATKETKKLATEVAKCFLASDILDVDELEESEFEVGEENRQEYKVCIDLVGCGRGKSASLAWLTWLQRLIEQGRQEGLFLLGVTKGLEGHQNTDVNLTGATRAGLYRMLQSEYKHLRSRHLDVAPSAGKREIKQQILAELTAKAEDTEVCYRKKQRYRAFLQERRLPGKYWQEGLEGVSSFPADCVLFITGGTRGLGYLCARHFVTKHGVKRLVLTGRTEVLDQQRARNVKALKELGAQVKVLSLPLTDEETVEQACQEIKATMGPIGGVLHCAGVVDKENPAFIRKSRETFQRVLSPKVTGSEVLYRCLHKGPLRFFILFSSVATAVPTLGAGQSDYAMANAYLDYLAEACAHECPLFSIQWPSWKETGMGEVQTKAFLRTGLLSLRDEEGLRLLDYVLAHKPGPVVMPAVVNPEVWEPEALLQSSLSDSSGENLPQKAVTAVSAFAASAATEGNGNKEGNRKKAVMDWLQVLLAGELKLKPSEMDVAVSLQEYGLDSILLAQVITRMEKELEGVSLEPAMFLEYPTIEGLAEYLLGNCPASLSSLSPHEKENSEKENTGRENRGVVIRDKVAIIGMACHFPDAPDIAAYWENLKAGRESRREVPKSRWDWEEYYLPGEYVEGKSISKWGAFLDGIEDFDPEYFQIPADLAPYIDPLQRQWLEVSVEALADAGYKKSDLWGKRVGVFAGARTSGFAHKIFPPVRETIVGTGQNFITTHLAHICNFKGPNLVVDTACSSSLTAVHLAAQSLLRGESELALAGGVEVLLDESFYLILSAAKILSPDGRCKTFAGDADGIGLGEGCGVLVLKPLAKAVKDGDKIYGVIDGTAINNDGNTMGVTTPNPTAQEELIEAAAAEAGINPASITYVEAHGTGTLIGDPLELRGLTRVLAKHTKKRQFCGVGSVKSNMGHLLSASGAASMIKVLLAIAHQTLPPTLHCDKPNPRFNFQESPFYPVQELRTWQGENGLLRAGISAFGLGGNNAHIIVSNAGVPQELRASLQSRAPEPVVFKKSRYWPTKNPQHEEQEFLELFEPERVEMEGDKEC